MGNIIIVGILIVVIALALSSTLKHFKGEGGCCGGSGSVGKETKKLSAPKLGEKEVMIEGMHCENCKNSVERAVNSISGAVCKVKLKKKLAIVSYSEEIEDSVIKSVIEAQGFEVKSIRKI